MSDSYGILLRAVGGHVGREEKKVRQLNGGKRIATFSYSFVCPHSLAENDSQEGTPSVANDIW
jgi:hypothetical protein